MFEKTIFTLLVAMVASPALADNQNQRQKQRRVVERVVTDEYGNSQDVVADDYDYAPQQRAVRREGVIVVDEGNDDYERHLRNQARIRTGLGLGLREALRIQRLRELQRLERLREREFLLGRQFSRRRDRDFLLLDSGPFFDPFSVFPRRRFIPGRSFIQFGF
jgi:hypothetical protein